MREGAHSRVNPRPAVRTPGEIRGLDADFSAEQAAGVRLAIRAIQRFVVLAEDRQRLGVMVDLLVEQQAIVLIFSRSIWLSS